MEFTWIQQNGKKETYYSVRQGLSNYQKPDHGFELTCKFDCPSCVSITPLQAAPQ